MFGFPLIPSIYIKSQTEICVPTLHWTRLVTHDNQESQTILTIDHDDWTYQTIPITTCPEVHTMITLQPCYTIEYRQLHIQGTISYNHCIRGHKTTPLQNHMHPNTTTNILKKPFLGATSEALWHMHKKNIATQIMSPI